MKFVSNEVKLDFSDVLIIPKTSSLESRSDVSVQRAFKLKHAGWEWAGIPIIAANMDTTGTLRMSQSLAEIGLCTALHKHHKIEEIRDALSTNFMNVFYSMGISDKDFDKITKEKFFDPRMICLDVANGYTQRFIDSVKKLRDLYPKTFIMAGNVVTYEKAEQVINAGADCVKIGIGPGAVCTTRIKTGIGYPQFSAILECADAAHGVGGLVCGDGGCAVPGDIVKAFAAGADFVMIGGMLAGTSECAGEVIWGDNNEPTHMKFYGMSSKTANDRYAGGLNDYRAAEGKEVLVPFKGDVKDVVQDILGGLRSALTYTGSLSLKELTKRASFVIVNNQHNKIFDD